MKKILVVDDESGIRKLFQAMITRSNSEYLVEEAGNGLQALEALESGEFDLVISDIEMPGMTGLELAREIKSRFPHILIILTTGKMGQYMKDILALGVDGWLSKPCRAEELQSKVDKLLVS